uniref:LIM zinc-binding domain-containing protein n=1 Tax=Heliothis virescens TaxID=7102 RepID=A0A2A4J4L7_HELVI
MYRPNFYESTCFRCNEIVYQVDRVGPLKDFTFFHSGCFKCAVCGTKLTLKTYYNNQHWTEDKEVYCSSHVPKIGPGHLDNSSVGIRSALNVPKSNNYVNEQIRGLARNSHDNEYELLKIAPSWVSTLLIQCAAGTLGGFTTTFLTNPLDIVRARLQVEGVGTMKDIFKTLWAEEGLLGLYFKGLSARLVQSACFSFSIILGYESIKRVALAEEFKPRVRW